ncbi:MAG: hypothetical protein AABY73_07710 [Pseudomonadota bacterium]
MRRLLLVALVFVCGLGVVGCPMGVRSKESPEAVKRRAEAIAGDKPYCIQVWGNGNYKEASLHSDLAFSAPDNSWELDYQAFLVEGSGDNPKVLYWSFGKKTFIDGTRSAPPLVCTPRLHFAENLKMTPGIEPSHFDFRVAGRKFSVPYSYRPVVRGGGDPGMTFFAAAPSFSALGKLPAYGQPVSMEDINHHIEVEFRRSDRLHTWLQKTDSSNNVQEAGSAFGLNRDRVGWHGGLSSRTPNEHFQYFFQSADGQITTLIRCPDSQRGYCMHTFYHNGYTYTFHHTPANLPNWKEMQRNLGTLMNSFIIKSDNPARESNEMTSEAE